MKDARLRILIVDDEPGIRNMLTTRFELDGHMSQSSFCAGSTCRRIRPSLPTWVCPP